MNLAAMRSRMKDREVSTRKQVGDTESMVNEEGKEVEEERQQL